MLTEKLCGCNLSPGSKLGKEKNVWRIFFWSGVVLLAVSRNVKFVIQENPTLSFGNSSVKLSISTFSPPNSSSTAQVQWQNGRTPKTVGNRNYFVPKLTQYCCDLCAFERLSASSQPKTACLHAIIKKDVGVCKSLFVAAQILPPCSRAEFVKILKLKLKLNLSRTEFQLFFVKILKF